MKKLLLLPLIAAAMTFASCAEDETVFENPTVDQPSGDVTRAMFAEDDGAKVLNGAAQVNAKNLLKNSDLSITEISDSLGFSNPNYFCTVFRQYCNNISPSLYRKKYRMNS